MNRRRAVISPTSKKNGGILDSTRPFSSFKLDENDVLEMWFKPRLIQVAVQTSEGKAKLKKVIALDYGLPLAFLVSNIQTCFEIGLDEFVFQASTVAADGSVSHAGWLNANETLEAQRFSGDSCLLLVPLDILELVKTIAKTITDTKKQLYCFNQYPCVVRCFLADSLRCQRDRCRRTASARDGCSRSRSKTAS